MTTKEWRGCFAIPMTPFDDKDRIDEDVLCAEIEFCIQSGVGGVAREIGLRLRADGLRHPHDPGEERVQRHECVAQRRGLPEGGRSPADGRVVIA